MDTLTSLKIFCQVVELGSFAKAAHKLGISNATASKHINHLERHVGAKLLQRNTRNLHLTEAGVQYHKDALHALETLDTAARLAHSGCTNPTGVLKLTMPIWFANPLVALWLTEYRSRYPDVTLDLSLTNRVVDLVAEGFDLALRVTPEPKPTLIARPLANMEFCLVAAPHYLSSKNLPKTPQDLLNHQYIRPSYVKFSTLSLVKKVLQNQPAGNQADNQAIIITPNVCIHSDDTLMTLELVKAGAGISYLPKWLIEPSLADGTLVRLLEDYELFNIRLYAVYADRRMMSAKVRSFIDFLVEKAQQQSHQA